MNKGEKRREDDPLTEVQSANRQWWTERTMSYDWNDKITRERFSEAWFDDADQRFIHGARLFAHDREPFDAIIPFTELRGKRVLEIGCGMGLHSELLLRAGADLTSIDISDTSVEATTRRLALKDLRGDVRQMDAEFLDFPDATFDFVWSWGVIHHTSRTGRVIREVHRVMKPGGAFRAMVYNIGSMYSYITMMRHYSWKFWLGKSLDETLWAETDGFTARYYSRDMLGDIFRIFFDDVNVAIFGQDADVMPLPSLLRRFALRFVSEARQRELVTKRGAFLFVNATKPAI